MLQNLRNLRLKEKENYDVEAERIRELNKIDGDFDEGSLIYSDITEFSQFDDIYMKDLTHTPI